MRRRLILGFLSENGQCDLEGQGQWLAFSLPADRIPGCMVGANVVILVQICDELFCGQAEFSRILGQNGQNDLEGKGQWPPFSIPAASSSSVYTGLVKVFHYVASSILRSRKPRRTDVAPARHTSYCQFKMNSCNTSLYMTHWLAHGCFFNI